MDLLIIVIVSLLFIPLALFTSGVIRIIIGLLLVAFLPGYVLLAALFPENDSQSAIERTAMSIGISVAIVSLISLALNYTAWGVQIQSVTVSIAIFIIILAFIAWLRRRKLPSGKRFTIDLNRLRFSLLRNSWVSQNPWNKVLSIFLAVAIIFTIGTIVYVTAASKNSEHFTEFFILGRGGAIENYPRNIVLGDPAEVTLGVINHESRPMTYQVAITINGEETTRTGTVYLKHQERWEQDVSFTPTRAGDNQKVEFLLYIDDVLEAVQTLHLWVDVKP
jgi:uncharacterized membrane protein